MRRAVYGSCFALVTALVAAPAVAEKLALPEACESFLMVQSKGCFVSMYARCDGAPEGTLFEFSYDGDGPYSRSVYDREFQWLDTEYFTDGTRERLVDPGPDPVSLTDLLAAGEDTYDFTIREVGPDVDRKLRITGHDRLTGKTAEIDGTALLRTEFASKAVDADTGEEIFSIEGRQFVLEGERIFFLGTDTFTQDGDSWDNDNSPMRFVRPGQVGFGWMTPQFECEGGQDTSFVPGEAMR